MFRGPSKAYQKGGGIGIQLFNSIYLLLITMIISLPISLGAGIYLSEYAKKNWVTNLIRTSIEILSSLPSVVVGLFGFLIFVIQFGYGFSILSGALALTYFNRGYSKLWPNLWRSGSLNLYSRTKRTSFGFYQLQSIKRFEPVKHFPASRDLSSAHLED